MLFIIINYRRSLAYHRSLTKHFTSEVALKRNTELQKRRSMNLVPRGNRKRYEKNFEVWGKR